MFCVLFSPQLYDFHCRWLGLKEDVVEPNMEARVKSHYGQSEVWSL